MKKKISIILLLILVASARGSVINITERLRQIPVMGTNDFVLVDGYYRIQESIRDGAAAGTTASQPGHAHIIGDVTGLQAELDGKASTGTVAAIDTRVTGLESGTSNWNQAYINSTNWIYWRDNTWGQHLIDWQGSNQVFQGHYDLLSTSKVDRVEWIETNTIFRQDITDKVSTNDTRLLDWTGADIEISTALRASNPVNLEQMLDAFQAQQEWVLYASREPSIFGVGSFLDEPPATYAVTNVLAAGTNVIFTGWYTNAVDVIRPGYHSGVIWMERTIGNSDARMMAFLMYSDDGGATTNIIVSSGLSENINSGTEPYFVGGHQTDVIEGTNLWYGVCIRVVRASGGSGATIITRGGVEYPSHVETPGFGTAGFLTEAAAAATYVPLTRTITINGVTYSLDADREWTIDSGWVSTAESDLNMAGYSVTGATDFVTSGGTSLTGTAATASTATQPGDDVSTLENDAGYLTAVPTLQQVTDAGDTTTGRVLAGGGTFLRGQVAGKNNAGVGVWGYAGGAGGTHGVYAESDQGIGLTAFTEGTYAIYADAVGGATGVYAKAQAGSVAIHADTGGILVTDGQPIVFGGVSRTSWPTEGVSGTTVSNILSQADSTPYAITHDGTATVSRVNGNSQSIAGTNTFYLAIEPGDASTASIIYLAIEHAGAMSDYQTNNVTWNPAPTTNGMSSIVLESDMFRTNWYGSAEERP